MKGLYKTCDIYLNVKCEIRSLYDPSKNISDAATISGSVVMAKNSFKSFLHFTTLDKKFSLRVA